MKNDKCEYENNGERITAPGKFDGEPVFAPHFWQLALEGFSDNDDGQLIRPTTENQKMKSKLVQIFFFNGETVETTEVLHADLPRLAGARTFWRESIPDALRGVLLKKKIALEFKKSSKTA